MSLADLVADLVADLGAAWTWVLAGLALAGLELAAPGIFLIWLGLAALVTGLVAALVPLPWQAQVLLFAGLAIAAVLLAGRLGRPRAATLNRADRGLVGREGLLAEPIRDGTGRIRFDDTLWRVTGPDLPAGTRAGDGDRRDGADGDGGVRARGLVIRSRSSAPAERDRGRGHRSRERRRRCG